MQGEMGITCLGFKMLGTAAEATSYIIRRPSSIKEGLVPWQEAIRGGGWEVCWCLQERSQRALCLPGLLCFVAGITVVTVHYFNLDLLKNFFDLHEDKSEEYQEMIEVYVNPHFVSKGLPPSQPSKLNPNSV